MLYAVKACDGYYFGNVGRHKDFVIEVNSEDEMREFATNASKEFILENNDTRKLILEEAQDKDYNEVLDNRCAYYFCKLNEDFCSASLDYMNSLSYDEVVERWGWVNLD